MTGSACASGQPYYDNNNVPKKRRGRKKRRLEEDEEPPSFAAAAAAVGYLDGSYAAVEAAAAVVAAAAGGKTKRARTSFKHHQLRVMKEHFQHNQNPDSRELKVLSQNTGLDKKVLQVRAATATTATMY